MKYFELTAEEQEIEKAFEKGQIVPVKNLVKVKAELRKIAIHTFSKIKNINLRLAERTILKLKAKAIAEGIPYQTLAASVLHKFVSA